MKILVVTARHTWGWTRRLGVLAVILLAVTLAAGRLLTPWLEDQRAVVERQLGEYLQARVQIGELHAAWQGWRPVVRISSLRLRDGPGRVPAADFDRAWAIVDLPRSLLAGRPVFGTIRLEGARLVVERRQRVPDLAALLDEWAGWLLHVHSLDLILDELELRQHGAPALVLQDFRLSLRNGEERRRLGFSATLAGRPGGRLRAAAELRGVGGGWQVRFYARGEDLDFAGWRALPARLEQIASDGRATVEIWGGWDDGRLTALVGRAGWRDPPVAPVAAGPGRLAKLAVVFDGGDDGAGWRWRSAWKGGNAEGALMLDCAMELRQSEDAAPPSSTRLRGRCQDLSLRDLVEIASPWLDPPQQTLLRQLAPTGAIPELTFGVDLADGSRATDYRIEARVVDLASRGWKDIPAVAGLDGVLTLTRAGGRLDLEGREVQVTAADWLRAPLRLTTLAGPLHWRYDGATVAFESGGLTLVADGVNARLRGTAVVPRDGADLRLDLKLNLTDLALTRVADFLPVRIMQPRLVEWLDTALVAGRVAEGSLVFKGRPADFPFDGGEGLFRARLPLRNVVLDYTPGWPALEAPAGEMVFHNRRFQAEAADGQVLDARIERVQARIENLADPRLTIQGQARGSAATLLQLVRETPLQERLGGYVEGLQAAGENTLALELHIPFHQQPVEVGGKLGFHGGEIDLPGWDVQMTQLQGAVRFTEDRIEADGLALRFRGVPARLAIETRARQDGRQETRFLLGGRLGAATQGGPPAARLPPALLEGAADWQVVLIVPAARPGAGPSELDLLAESDLQGLAVGLPAPLGKRAHAQRTLLFHLRWSGDQRLEVWLDYAPELRALLELTGLPDGLRLQRGQLRIGAGAARLPEAPGLAVVAHLPRLEWPAGGDQGLSIPPWLSTVEARIDELALGSQRFGAVELQLERRRDAYALSLEGENIAGRIHLPDDPSPAVPVGIELRRLALRRGSGAGSERPMDPRAVPPLWLTVKDLVLDGRSLGRLRLSARPQPDGLRLENLTLESELHEIVASGDWTTRPSGQSSRLQATLHSPALGETLRAFGYTIGLDRGEAEVELELSAPTALPDLAPERLDGRLDLRIGRGQLLNVEPGVGRMIGLFNLDSLSRRLALDFSDLFRKGLAFDRIEGRFTFRSGQAWTEDLSLKGPSARIEVQGRIDLAERRYDQIVTVMPRFGLALPLAGTLAGGPVVGAAVFVAERVLQGEIGRVARYRYAVKGSWDDPSIEGIGGDTVEPADVER